MKQEKKYYSEFPAVKQQFLNNKKPRQIRQQCLQRLTLT